MRRVKVDPLDPLFGGSATMPESNIAIPQASSAAVQQPVQQDRQVAAVQEAQQPDKTAALPDSNTEAQQPVQQRTQQSGDLARLVASVLAARASVSATFRYSDEEIALMDDVGYEVRKSHGVKLTKQDLLRIGLALAVEDYRKNGHESAVGIYVRMKGRLPEP